MSDDDRPTTEIPDDNPFREVIVALRSDGHTWTEIHELLEAAYDPVDRAAYEASKREVPIFEARVVKYDHNSTSQERYDTKRIDGMETAEEARERLEELHDIIRVEHVEQVDTVTVV